MAYMNIKEVEDSIKKIDYMNQEEIENMKEIIRTYNEFNEVYNTSNLEIIEKIYGIEKDNLNFLKELYENNLIIIEKIKNKYETAKINSERIINNGIGEKNE